MKYMKVDTPAIGVVTLRLNTDENTFMPAATGLSGDKLVELRTSMEKLEIEASVDTKPGYISRAAGPKKSMAIKNARYEAIEKMSLSAWWSLNRPSIGKVSIGIIKKLLRVYFPSGDFQLSIGFVEPVCGTGYVAVSILQNTNKFPFAVLGSCYSNTPKSAMEKAFFESIQSWCATNWLRINNKELMPYWDLGELRRRSLEILSSTDLDLEGKTNFDKKKLLKFIPIKYIQTQSHLGKYVAWVYMDKSSDLNFEIAKLVKRKNETTQIFSAYNY